MRAKGVGIEGSGGVVLVEGTLACGLGFGISSSGGHYGNWGGGETGGYCCGESD